jgi:hypothetical protein
MSTANDFQIWKLNSSWSSPHSDFPFTLRTERAENLAQESTDQILRKLSLTGDLRPGDAAVGGLETVTARHIPHRGVQRVGRPDQAEILRDR